MAPASREPGAPIGKDELDPELVRLRRPGLDVGILTAAGIVILCVILMVRLRHDFAFARAGSTPRSVTVDAIAKGELGSESFITVDATPDRASALRLRVKEGSLGNRLVPVRGGGDRVWLALPGEDWEHYRHDDRVVGRLRRLDEARMTGAINRGLRTFGAPRFMTGEALRAAKLGAGAAQVTLLDGTVVALDPTAEIELSVVDPGAAVVVAAKSPSRATEAAWSEALVAAGVITPGQPPMSTTDDLIRWEVRRADALISVQTAVDGAQLWGARVEPSTTNLRTPLAKLVTSDAGVTGTAGIIPWSAIDVAALWAPRTVSGDAWVVLVDERPGDYWYLNMVYGGLALIGLLSMWGLVRAVRRTFFDGTASAAR